jgi:hypothetical protein
VVPGMEDRVAERASNGAAAHPSGDERFGMLDKALKRTRYSQDQLIEILHVAQELFGYLSEDVLIYVGRALRLPLSRVFGVATFYHLFTFEEPGDHSATVCTGTACFVKGADGSSPPCPAEFRSPRADHRGRPVHAEDRPLPRVLRSGAGRGLDGDGTWPPRCRRGAGGGRPEMAAVDEQAATRPPTRPIPSMAGHGRGGP